VLLRLLIGIKKYLTKEDTVKHKEKRIGHFKDLSRANVLAATLAPLNSLYQSENLKLSIKI